MDGFELAEQIREDPRLAGAVIMMLTSTGQVGDAARCRRLGISAYLLKPIRKSELLSAILTALGQQAPTAPRPLGAATGLELGGSGLRVLLVEANAVNQTVALRLLQKMGQAVLLANNGREALALLSTEEFDRVLMDVQMPEMDGLTASQQFRAAERNSGRHIPIVAMTTRAMRGDRATCLAAGMDAYISKPVDLEELATVLRQIRFGIERPVLEAKTAAWSISDPVQPSAWNAGKVLENMVGDHNSCARLWTFFCKKPRSCLRACSKVLALAIPEQSKPQLTA
jgi:CheY-like chemotaxis protein